MATNPRWKSGKRRKFQARFRAMNLPCSICGKPIDYSIPSTPQEKWSFVIDERCPVSKWKEFGYSSPEECADDPNNVFPAHRYCNALKGNKVGFKIIDDPKAKLKMNRLDGKW